MRLACQLIGYYAYRHERRFPDVRFTEAKCAFANLSRLAYRFGRGETLIGKNTVDRSADTHILGYLRKRAFGIDQTVLVAFPGEFAAVAICSKTSPAGDAPFEERAYGPDGAFIFFFWAVLPY